MPLFPRRLRAIRPLGLLLATLGGGLVLTAHALPPAPGAAPPPAAADQPTLPSAAADTPPATPAEDGVVIPGRPVRITVPPYNPAHPPVPLHQPAPLPDDSPRPVTLPSREG